MSILLAFVLAAFELFFKFVIRLKSMKNKYLLPLFLSLLLPGFISAQKRPVGTKQNTSKKALPEMYYSESGIPLRLEEKKDKNGQVIEKTFYRDRSKVKSDTINEKQLFNNGKLYETQYYTGEGKLSFLSRFDENGKAAETVFYDKSGEIDNKTTYSHGINGTTKEVRYQKGDVIRSTEITDGDGRMLTKMEFSEDGTLSRNQVCQYDGPITACKKRECLSYNSAGILTYKETFDHVTKRREDSRYFESGKMKSYELREGSGLTDKLLEMDFYEEDGSYRKQMMVTFAKSYGKRKGGSISKASEVTSYNAEGKLKSKLTYTYDDKGNETEVMFYDGSGKLISHNKHEYIFDAEGEILEDKTATAAGKWVETDTYTRDEKGRAKDMVRKKADGTSKYIIKDGKRVE